MQGFALRRFLDFSRPRTSNAFVPELDGLRFIAITLVVLHHNHFMLHNNLPSAEGNGTAWNLYQNLVAAGGLGVPLFFVISGVVLGLPFARQHLQGGKPVKLKDYFWRRVRRLEPPYIINLSILFLLAIASGGAAAFFDRLPHYLASLFYVHNTIYNDWSEVNFVAWSLEVEAQFYALAPILGLIFTIGMMSRRVMIYVAFFVVLSFIQFLTLSGPFRVSHSILALGQYFIVGLLLADLMVRGRLYAERPSVGFDVLAIVFFVLAVLFDLNQPVKGFHALGVFPMLMFFLCVFRGRLILGALRVPIIYTIGGMCYTIYLYHFWIIQVLVRGLDLTDLNYSPAGVLAFDVAMTVFVFAVSSVFFLLFEKPFMNRQSSPPTQPATS